MSRQIKVSDRVHSQLTACQTGRETYSDTIERLLVIRMITKKFLDAITTYPLDAASWLQSTAKQTKTEDQP